MDAEIRSNGGWSDPTSWVGGQVPQSSNGLHVTGSGLSTEDLGTPDAPFITNDVDITTPFAISGAMSSHDISSPFVTVFQQGGLTVRHDANANFALIDQGVLEIGHGISGGVSFLRGGLHFVHDALGAVLILDQPPKGQFNSFITLPANQTSSGQSGPPQFAAQIELAKVQFDHADLIPNPGGGGSYTLQLSEAGKNVYAFTNVKSLDSGGGTAGVLSVGYDAKTGNDFVAYRSV